MTQGQNLERFPESSKFMEARQKEIDDDEVSEVSEDESSGWLSYDAVR